MSSSISSSRPATPGKTIGWAALAVLVFFIAAEIFTRQVLMPSSLDFVRFVGYPAAADALCQKPAPRIAFVGNSATQRGIDPQRLHDDLTDVHTEFFLVDGSMIN